MLWESNFLGSGSVKVSSSRSESRSGSWLERVFFFYLKPKTQTCRRNDEDDGEPQDDDDAPLQKKAKTNLRQWNGIRDSVGEQVGHFS